MDSPGYYVGKFAGPASSGEKNKTRPVAPAFGEAGNQRFIVSVGYAEEYARPVTGFIVRAFRAPVLHPLQYLKSPFQNVMRRAALNIRYKSYAARIMFIFLSV
jgi:hypothetical protein